MFSCATKLSGKHTPLLFSRRELTSSVNFSLSLRLQVAYGDPEFILKLAYHIRNELNIRQVSDFMRNLYRVRGELLDRSTANFLVAMACAFPITKSFIGTYFSSIVRLPSDLLDVVRYIKQIAI